jgi:hypothetical protein
VDVYVRYVYPTFAPWAPLSARSWTGAGFAPIGMNALPSRPWVSRWSPVSMNRSLNQKLGRAVREYLREKYRP